jgi:hypothetical protein
MLVGANYGANLAPRYEQFAITHAQLICNSLGLPLGGAEQARIAKFIRSNGHVEILQAVGETKQRIQKSHGLQAPTPVGDPWAYALGVANGAWARSRDLYLRLGLYEHGLRTRVQELVTYHLGPGWWQSPPKYMRAKEWRNLLRTNPSIRTRPSTGPNDLPPMQAFPSAESFVEKLNLSELHQIVLHLWSPILTHLLNSTAQPHLSYGKMERLSWQISDLRNNVMHMRFIPKSAYPGLVDSLERLLTPLEFDVGKAVARITTAVPV